MGRDKCNKVMYPTEEAAVKDSHRISKKRGKDANPLAAYYCVKHDCWHLTSILSWKDKELNNLSNQLLIMTNNFNSRKQEIKRLRTEIHSKNTKINVLEKGDKKIMNELNMLRKWKKEFLEITSNV